ncbi:C39 family peptidase [Oceanobacillus salinisoli]|uniref:C39 family peptidase n=1 Tax=Oceanobacillus salinisoli TaxID=2678611 RepID=UPI0012E1EC43|nr:C39 family peptidase [Oceanobacillus salinisoli]
MILLNVPIISQQPELPTGCEITAVTMMLQYKGVDLDKLTLAKEMPRHPEDPNLGYVGDPFTPEGWTVYPPALINLIEKYAGSAIDLTDTSNDKLEEYLSNDKPVVVLVASMHGFTVHALTLTGFDEDHYYYNDPWTAEKDVKITKEIFHKIWEGQNKRAVSF